MNFKTFRIIFDKIPKNLTQIAFGIGDIDSNPDMWEMLKYCLDNQIIPNITINGYKINSDIAKKLAKYCGAVAVSHYDDNYCFNAVKLLADAGLKQINIHKMIAKETLNSCYELLNKTKKDNRLKKLNAIVFLSLKKKGRGIDFHQLSQIEFSELIHYAFRQEILIGFDSCSSHKFINAIKDHEKKHLFEMISEPCESACFSQYINVEGKAFPCSFLENENGYEGIDLLNTENFLKDVWFENSTKQFRQKLIIGKRECPHFII